jgi:hypothetical protein
MRLSDYTVKRKVEFLYMQRNMFNDILLDCPQNFTNNIDKLAKICYQFIFVVQRSLTSARIMNLVRGT